jgi:DNA-binding CsgD family transcriptional regulator/PAS domain-containing protein
MPCVNALSDLIGDLYETALDQSLWSNALEKCARFVGGTAAALVAKDAMATGGNAYHDFGIEPYYATLYLNDYINCDPAISGYSFAEIEQPVTAGDFMPYDEYLMTRFYLEWARPQQLGDFVSATLDKSAAGATNFRVFRHDRDGPAGDEMRRNTRLVVPHIRRALRIGRMLEAQKAEAASISDVLDGLKCGVFLVDGIGRIVHVNAAGGGLLETGDLLRTVSGRVVLWDAAADEILQEAVALPEGGDAGRGAEGIALSLLSRTSERYVAQFMPLAFGARRRNGSRYAAVAALFIRKAVLQTSSLSDIIGRAYKLTPTELRVLLAIVEVGGVPEVSEALGIAVTTVKTHLGRLFEKTGVDRQADLVKVVAGFATPLTG